ncbi:unnamed protein product [Arctogadus glacialis]
MDTLLLSPFVPFVSNSLTVSFMANTERQASPSLPKLALLPSHPSSGQGRLFDPGGGAHPPWPWSGGSFSLPSPLQPPLSSTASPLLHSLPSPPQPPLSSTASPLLHSLPSPHQPPLSSTASPLLTSLPSPPQPPLSSTASPLLHSLPSPPQPNLSSTASPLLTSLPSPTQPPLSSTASPPLHSLLLSLLLLPSFPSPVGG